MPGSLRILVSACLSGQRVRYNGGHKLAAGLMRALATPFSLLAVRHSRFSAEFSCLDFAPKLIHICPETECGLGTPREPMRLEGDAACPKVVTVNSRRDMTEPLCAQARGRILALGRNPPDAAILKKGSPSCGVHGTPVFSGPGGEIVSPGSGVFALAFRRAFPFAPLVQESDLEACGALETFLLRAALARAWRHAVNSGGETLARFHFAHARVLLAAFGAGADEFVRDFPHMNPMERLSRFSALLARPLSF